MATENNHDNKESVPEKSAVPNEIKATKAEKSEAVTASATDKVNDAAKAAGNVFAKAKGLANDAIKTAKSDATKQSLNDAAKTAAVLGSKFLAKAKVVAGDVKKELKEVNDIRKDTFASAEAGTSKKALAKGFWAKLSGKQKGLLAGILAICVYVSYSVLFGETLLSSRPSIIDSTNDRTRIGSCFSVTQHMNHFGLDMMEYARVKPEAEKLGRFLSSQLSAGWRDGERNQPDGLAYTRLMCQNVGNSQPDCTSADLWREYRRCSSKYGK